MSSTADSRTAIGNGLRAAHFSDRRHAEIFAAITAVLMRTDVTAVTVRDQLQSTENVHPETVGRLGDIAEGRRPTDFFAAVEHVRQLAEFREVEIRCLQAIDRCRTASERPLVLAAKLRGHMDAIVQGRSSIPEVDKEELAKAVSELAGGGPRPLHFATGIRSIDTRWRLFDPGHFTLMAAGSSVGKSTVAINLLLHEALRGTPCVYLTAEMTPTATMQRASSCLSGIDLTRIANGLCDRDEQQRVSEAGARLAESGLRIVERRNPSAADIAGMLPRLIDDGAQLVCIDSLDLMDHNIWRDRVGRGADRNAMIRETSKALFELAGRYQIPFLVLHQLNRTVTRDGRRPTMQDLRDGAVENDADNVLLLYRPEYHLGEKAEPEQQNAIEFIVGKGRHVGVGSQWLYFDAAKMKVADREDRSPL